MRYLITGATGFIGKRLVKDILLNGGEVSLITRNPLYANKIFPKTVIIYNNIKQIENDRVFDVIINLAGEPIAAKKWNKTQKEKLINSRVITTKSIIELISSLNTKPECIISASAVGYYGSQDNKIIDEKSVPNKEFTNELCSLWESEANKANTFNVRVCIVRFGVVLGKSEGALKRLLPAFIMGLGGKIGDGNQYFSWIHIEDVLSSIKFLIKNKNSKGIYNLTSPAPVTNAEFTLALSKTLKRPTFLNVPAPVVKFLFGEMGEALLLNGQRVVPTRLLNEGFTFGFVDISTALKNIIQRI